MVSVATKTGDEGTSMLFDGKRYSKTELTYEVLGEIDELNSTLGVAKEKSNIETKKIIEKLQQDMLDLGAHFASLRGLKALPFGEDKLTWVEKNLAEIETRLPKLTEFILPGGSNGGAELHHARSVCRKLERTFWKFHSIHPEIDTLPGKYLNRLSDYLFQLGRFVSL